MTDPARWLRASLVVAVAVLLGAILLAQRSSKVTVVETAQSTTVRTTVPRSPPATASATTAPPHDPAQVKVLVLNGVDAKKAIAGPAAQSLVAAGFSNTTGHNAAANAPTTAVYFVPGYQADATLVAGALRFPPSAVQPLPSPTPPAVGNPQDANVVVVVGADSAPPNG